MRAGNYTCPLFFCFNMPNTIDRALDTLYEIAMKMPNKVLDIFNNFFGEERVDMQGFLSKSDLRTIVLATTIDEIFDRAGRNISSVWKGYSGKRLSEINFESIPDIDITFLSEVISSAQFIQTCKTICTVEDCFILVHFPQVTVTNEHNRSTVVNHIYIKVPITIDGKEDGLFTMNRSEYIVAEIYSGYMHSHASHIPTDDFESFVGCCLGSGPLRYTQSILSTGFDEDRWNMFCLELSKYVETESLQGIPYHKLENISFGDYKVNNVDRLSNYSYVSGRGTNNTRSIVIRTIREFIEYYIDNNNLIFSYRNGIYSLGMPYISYLIHLSNSFIEYINSKPELVNPINNYGIIERYTIVGENLFSRSESMNDSFERYRQYIGQTICTFKNKPVTIEITDINNISNPDNEARLINISLASQLLNVILRVINYRYGRNQENTESTSSKVRYKI